MRVDPPAGPIHTRPYGPGRRALVARYAGPIHTRPYGPGRRALVARYAGPLTEQQAAEVRDVIAARLPGCDLLIVDHRWTLQPLTDPEPNNAQERTP